MPGTDADPRRPRFRSAPPPSVRGQAAAMGVLLVVMGLLLAARAWWLRQPPAQTPVVIEVRGDIPQPGFYPLTPPARARDALRAAGVEGDGFVDAALEPGTRLVVEGGAWRAEPMAERLVFGLPIDVNTASVDALEAIPGVGPARAAAIVVDRTENGDFRSLDDLDRVRGIGPATVDALRPYATVGEGP